MFNCDRKTHTTPEKDADQCPQVLDTDVSECSIEFRCDRIRDDDDGGIIEAPDLLKHVNATKERIAALLQGKIEVGPIVAKAGRYSFRLHIDPEQRGLLPTSIESLLLPQIEHATTKVRANARTVSPGTLSQLGVAKEMAGALAGTLVLDFAKTPGNTDIATLTYTIDATTLTKRIVRIRL